MLATGVDLEAIRTAWENLETARHILQTRLETAELGEEERRSLVNRLAIVFVRLGDCEAWQDKFKEAIEAYSHSATLREQIENPQTSRGIAEVYFMIANTIGYMPEAPLSALDYYHKAADILHHILLDKYEKLGIEAVADRDRILQDRAADDDSIKEIKSILREMNLRIEDARLEEVERERYLQAKQAQEAENRQALNAFGKPVVETEEKKVKNLGFFGTRL